MTYESKISVPRFRSTRFKLLSLFETSYHATTKITEKQDEALQLKDEVSLSFRAVITKTRTLYTFARPAPINAPNSCATTYNGANLSGKRRTIVIARVTTGLRWPPL